MQIISGLMIPFLGTTLGAAFIFIIKKDLKGWVEQSMMGFAAGVMTAASIWSLLIPAMELESHLGKFSFLPAAVGFILGILFLAGSDRMVMWIHRKEHGVAVRGEEGWKKNTLMVLAVTVHNIPEGLSVGAAFAGLLTEHSGVSVAGAFALSVGIAIQNLPEGFIVALPYRNRGDSRRKSFLYGMASGIVEPLGGAVMILLTAWLRPLLPYLLAFSAGAMFYVILEELIPDAMRNRRFHMGTAGFSAGFLIMMILDVALG